MARNIVTVSGMFGTGKTYFADSPVVIDISGLAWPASSPFDVVHVKVLYKKPLSGNTYELIPVGDFRDDTGGQSTASFDISSALRTIWSDYQYNNEIYAADACVESNASMLTNRSMREYILRISTEYLSSDDGGVYTETQCAVVIDGVEYTDIPGGQCLMGGLTEWERSLITNKADADVSHLEHTNVRNGDASTKPISTPERVGSTSITSWVDVQAGLTKSFFYPAPLNAVLPASTGSADDTPGSQQGWTGHAPLVVRDNQPYIDFLFVNRRGAVETCSALMKEAMDINVDTNQYARTEGTSFKPNRTLMAIGNDGRRSWEMSSGLVTREWAAWWAQEFLGGKRKQWWMLWKGPGQTQAKYVPVTVKPAKNEVRIYDRTKQQMASVEFVVTLALEG